MTKFMYKEFLLTLVSLIFGIAGLNAQVTIGADETPHSGAVLDLRSDTTTGKGKGLKMPVVKIEDASKFQLSADASTAEGMMVFNINPSIIGGYGKGLYVWSNSTWNLVSPTVSVSGISLNKKSIKFETTTPDTLIAEVFPTYSVNNSVSWHSSNTVVATVSQDGIVTPKASGNAKVYATTTDGSNQSDSCTINVNIGGHIPTPVCSHGKIPSLIFAPYNLGADTNKINGIAVANNISKTKAYIKCSVDDWNAALGDLYQWGRIADGHEKRNSSVVSVNSLNSSNYNTATGQVTHATYKNYFITGIVGNTYDWQKTQNNNLWGNGVAINTSTSTGVLHTDGKYYQSTEWKIPSNNPCPSGFRVPTQDEWESIANYDCKPNATVSAKSMSTSAYSYDMTETGLTWVRVKDGKASNNTSWSDGNHTGWAIYKTDIWNAAGSGYKNGTSVLYEAAAPEPLLFLPAAGSHSDSNGSLVKTGYYGYYWSSSVTGNHGQSFYFDSSNVKPDINGRANGFSVRCAAK